MRKFLWIVLAALLFCGAAQAEMPGWAFEDEMFYHRLAYCGGEFERENVSAEGRYPCPVCATDAKIYDNGLYAVERGGTVVVRITDEYMNRGWETEGFFGFFSEDISGFAAYRHMCERLNGEALLEAAAQFLSADVQERQGRTIGVSTEYSHKRKARAGMEMSYRHIDGCQYWCLHPTGSSKLKDEDINWSITIYDVTLGGGTYWFSCEEVAKDLPRIIIDKGNGEEELYFEERGSLSVRIMQEADIYICVLREHGADAAALEDVELRIEGSYAPIRLNGYMDDTDGVFVCVLSDGEYRLISGGADVSLQR